MMHKQPALCDTTCLSTYSDSYYISAAASHLNTQSHHTQGKEHGCDMNYSKSREFLLTCCTAVSRVCAALYVEDALSHQILSDGDKRLPGQAALHGAAEAADRVSCRAGLVNLDIINTPLTAFCFTSRETQAGACTEYTC